MAVTKICQIKNCPEPSCVRLTDSEEGKYRRDLCYSHAMTTLHHYGRDKVDIVDTWNGKVVGDFDDDRYM